MYLFPGAVRVLRKKEMVPTKRTFTGTIGVSRLKMEETCLKGVYAVYYALWYSSCGVARSRRHLARRCRRPVAVVHAHTTSSSCVRRGNRDGVNRKTRVVRSRRKTTLLSDVLYSFLLPAQGISSPITASNGIHRWEAYTNNWPSMEESST